MPHQDYRPPTTGHWPPLTRISVRCGVPHQHYEQKSRHCEPAHAGAAICVFPFCHSIRPFVVLVVLVRRSPARRDEGGSSWFNPPSSLNSNPHAKAAIYPHFFRKILPRNAFRQHIAPGQPHPRCHFAMARYQSVTPACQIDRFSTTGHRGKQRR